MYAGGSPNDSAASRRRTEQASQQHAWLRRIAPLSTYIARSDRCSAAGGEKLGGRPLTRNSLSVVMNRSITVFCTNSPFSVRLQRYRNFEISRTLDSYPWGYFCLSQIALRTDPRRSGGWRWRGSASASWQALHSRRPLHPRPRHFARIRRSRDGSARARSAMLRGPAARRRRCSVRGLRYRCGCRAP